MIYEIVVGESIGLAKDRWLIQADSLSEAVQKAESRMKKRRAEYKGWNIVSAKEVGELSI